MTMGMATGTLSVPAATMATTIDVVSDELCTMLVASTPTNRPMNGLPADRIRASLKSLPMCLNPPPMSLMLTRNTYSSTTTPSTRRTGGIRSSMDGWVSVSMAGRKCCLLIVRAFLLAGSISVW